MSPGNPLWIDFFGKLGASPTTMAFPEVFTGLQTGTIKGQENPIEVPWTNKFSEVQKLEEFKATSKSLYPQFSQLIGKEFFDQAIAFTNSN